jgi:AraC-like DNA-binding protein
MDWCSPLLLRECRLAEEQEWQVTSPGWSFIRLSSDGVYWFGTPNQMLEAGEVVVVAPNVTGLVRASRLGCALLHYFVLLPELLAGFFTLSEHYHLRALAGRVRSPLRRFASDHPVAVDFTALVMGQTEGVGFRHRCGMLQIVARVLGDELDRAHPTFGSRPTARDRFVQLVNEIPASELINHTQEEWAQLCRCSVRHFNRLFRDFFGSSLSEIQAELRQAKAGQTLHCLLGALLAQS